MTRWRNSGYAMAKEPSSYTIRFVHDLGLLELYQGLETDRKGGKAEKTMRDDQTQTLMGINRI